MTVYYFICYIIGSAKAYFTVNEVVTGKVNIYNEMVLDDGILWRGKRLNFTEYHLHTKLNRLPHLCVPYFDDPRLIRVCTELIGVYYSWKPAQPVSKNITCSSSVTCKVHPTLQIVQCPDAVPTPTYRFDYTEILPDSGLRFSDSDCLGYDPKISALLEPNVTGTLWFKQLHVTFQFVVTYDDPGTSFPRTKQILNINFPAKSPQGTLDGVHGIWK
ncbi:hypothetical protein DSO57_1028580 [Entomophthora muscae]|uniref:Uncharacterized protein n=1 Tax=Entomophthora muscae TaxID=34485 RepID=A0ACC2RSL2_9FUNG|nr:hypothetical protein DSO57_1028580 [Entomophthora muscae]